MCGIGLHRFTTSSYITRTYTYQTHIHVQHILAGFIYIARIPDTIVIITNSLYNNTKYRDYF